MFSRLCKKNSKNEKIVIWKENIVHQANSMMGCPKCLFNHLNMKYMGIYSMISYSLLLFNHNMAFFTDWWYQHKKFKTGLKTVLLHLGFIIWLFCCFLNLSLPNWRWGSKYFLHHYNYKQLEKTKHNLGISRRRNWPDEFDEEKKKQVHKYL